MSIKKSIFLFISLLALKNLYGQDSAKHYFIDGIGIKSGITISQLVMKNSSLEEANGKTDFIYSPFFAVTTELLHYKNFLFGTDIGYIQRGGKADSYYNESYANSMFVHDSNHTTRLYFIAWNFAGKAGIGFGSYFYYISIGPGLNYLIPKGSYDKIHYSYINKKVFYNVKYGLGINHRTNRCIFSFETHCYFNITPLSKSYPYNCFPSAVDAGPICLEEIHGRLNSRDIMLNIGIKYLLNYQNK